MGKPTHLPPSIPSTRPTPENLGGCRKWSSNKWMAQVWYGVIGKGENALRSGLWFPFLAQVRTGEV